MPLVSRTVRKSEIFICLAAPKDKWLVILPVKGQEGMEGVGGGSVHRCHFSASERRQAEKLTLRLGVVIDGFRRLYCDDCPTGSSNAKHYFVDTIRGNPQPHRQNRSRPAPELFRRDF